MYKLGKKSLGKLSGVHPDLVAVIKRAIELTVVDFTVLEGLRSKERQRELVSAGASKTMNSRHITGHAVDLGAWVGGSVRWDWPLYYKIAAAVQMAADEIGTPIIWGGVWDRELSDIGKPEDGVTDYVERRMALGKNAFIDGPHFELSRGRYPA